MFLKIARPALSLRALRALPALVASSLLVFPAPATARDLPLGGVGFTRCAQLFPGGRPIDLKALTPALRPVGLCSNHFAVVSSAQTKTPLADAQGEERSNEFFADPRLAPGDRAELADFKGSGFDRGHLANAADQPDRESMIQSFALSNMVPQDPVNNRKGAWLKAEKDTRKYVRRAAGDVFVFSGPLFRGERHTIGPDRVWVPSHLFKLVYDESSGRAWAHIIENTADAQLGRPISYAAFVKETGWRLLPAALLQGAE